MGKSIIALISGVTGVVVSLLWWTPAAIIGAILSFLLCLQGPPEQGWTPDVTSQSFFHVLSLILAAIGGKVFQKFNFWQCLCAVCSIIAIYSIYIFIQWAAEYSLSPFMFLKNRKEPKK